MCHNVYNSLKNITEKQKERFDEIINNYVDAHNLILENKIECKKNGEGYTEKDARRDIKEKFQSKILDKSSIGYLFHELQGKFIKGESVELKEYEGDHSYRTSVRNTKFKYGRFHITHFKEEGLELEGDINREGFTSVKILRKDNKYYVIFGYGGLGKKKTKKDMKGKNYVYILSHPNYPGVYKVGIAKNWEGRLCSYNVGDPDREYKMEYTFLTSEDKAGIIEKLIHKIFPNKYEWVKAKKEDIIKVIEKPNNELKKHANEIAKGLSDKNDTKSSVKILREDNKHHVIFEYYIEEKIELKNLTDIQKERFDEIIKYNVYAHNIILENIIDAGISYTLNEARRDIREISKNKILDKSSIGYLFSELHRNIKKGESVELKEHGGDHSYRTSVRRTKVKYRILYIPRFKEGIELGKYTNIREGFTSVKILRKDNKYYVIFGYEIEDKREFKERFDKIIKYSIDAYNIILENNNGEVYTLKKVRHELRENLQNTTTSDRKDMRGILQNTTTSDRKDMREKRYVYILSHPNYPGEYKVGIAKNWEGRLCSYNAGDPDREYKMEYTFLTSKDEAEMIEKCIHKIFPNKYEWVKAKLQDIIKEIESLDKEVTEKGHKILWNILLQKDNKENLQK